MQVERDHRTNQAGIRAFTLLELLVVVAIIGILCALLFPAFSRSKQKAQGVTCLNNGRQMLLGLTMYVGDHEDMLPPNPDDGNTLPGHNWCGGAAGHGGREEFNPDVLRDPSRSLLVPYLRGNVAVFRCPTDKRMGLYQGKDPALIGRTVPSARTFSMSQAVGTICAGFDAGSRHAGAPKLAVHGPWLDNTKRHRRNAPWRTYSKLGTVQSPSPSMLWVLMDESDRALNDAAFAFGMERPIWYDVPGTYHDFGAGFAFADGHGETHAWASRSEKQGRGFQITNQLDRRDWLWMRERTSAHISGTMPAPNP